MPLPAPKTKKVWRIKEKTPVPIPSELGASSSKMRWSYEETTFGHIQETIKLTDKKT
uniref:Uncharacterized protein n=1 Tax=Oryza sativa subsp. japonica TaxID=39947 RepID=Q5VMQ6_ORYSJ|nr:hypothetical protein [Oryza sativa Japonica Group]